MTTIIWTDWNCRVSRYFTVGEVCKCDTRRVPHDPTVRTNILKLAAELDKVRSAWGGAIAVTSWHRPLLVNRAVGSSDGSQHIKGTAADIYPLGREAVAFERWLDHHWYGALGYGARSGKGFTHLDIRNGKGWQSGGTKGPRWNY